jgi:hypothetical protein
MEDAKIQGEHSQHEQIETDPQPDTSFKHSYSPFVFRTMENKKRDSTVDVVIVSPVV